MHTVHVRVNDAATGKPTPCRVRFTDAEGRYYAPFGRLADFVMVGSGSRGNVLIGDKRYAYIDGLARSRCRPPDHGRDPQRLRVHHHDEGSNSLTASWLFDSTSSAGSIHGKRDGIRATPKIRLSPHAALLEGAAEDLAVVNLLAERDPPLRVYDRRTKPGVVTAGHPKHPGLQWSDVRLGQLRRLHGRRQHPRTTPTHLGQRRAA